MATLNIEEFFKSKKEGMERINKNRFSEYSDPKLVYQKCANILGEVSFY